MADTHFSGEGSLIEANILGDPNNKTIPLVCDNSGRLIVDTNGITIIDGSVRIEDSTGLDLNSTSGALNVNVVNPTAPQTSVAVSNFPTNQKVTGAVTLGFSKEKTNVLITRYVPTFAPVQTSILMYTVPANTTFFLQSCVLQVNGTGISGIAKIQIPSGTDIFSAVMSTGATAQGIVVSEPIPLAAGTTINVVIVPNSGASTNWYANLIGYCSNLYI